MTLDVRMCRHSCFRQTKDFGAKLRSRETAAGHASTGRPRLNVGLVDWQNVLSASHTACSVRRGLGPNGGGSDGAIGRDACLAARDHASRRADGGHAPSPSA